MSTSAEIQEVFEDEVDARSRVVMNKYGPAPFYDGFSGMGTGAVLPDEFIEVCGAISRADDEYTPAVSTADRGSR